jgi:dTDP-4-dehydrorhamnose 3,5-epimerase
LLRRYAHLSGEWIFKPTGAAKGNYVLVTPTGLPEVLILEPQLLRDSRGFFFESYSRKRFLESTGCDPEFVQDNHSRSTRNVLRGLHYQLPPAAQAKLVRVVSGEIFDVAVDVRRSSATFGKWIGVRLSAENHRQLWIPEGFAHGFYTISDVAEVIYKVPRYYDFASERSILWNDPTLNIGWPLEDVPIVSAKDAAAPTFGEADMFQ